MISFDEQFQREVVADEAAAQRVFQQYAEAAASGNLDGLPRAKVLIGRLFTETHVAITELQAAIKPEDGKGVGAKYRRNPWAQWLLRVPADVLTVLLLRRVIRAGLLAEWSVSDAPTFQRLAIGLARDVEREALLADATVVNPVYVQRAFSSLKKANTVQEAHIQRTTDAVVVNLLQLESAQQLEDNELMHIGKLLLQICIDIGMLTVKHSTGAKGRMVTYQLMPEIIEFLRAKGSDVDRLVDATATCMLAPPVPWESIVNGGYYSPRRRAAFPLLLLNRQQYKDGLAKHYTAERIPQVYSACNYLQGTAFTIDPDVLEVVARVWAGGGGILGLPKLNLGEPPEFPFPEPWDKTAASEDDLQVFSAWRRQCSNFHTAVRKNAGKVLTLSRLLRKSHEFINKPLWCPVFIDWRSRVYYRGTPNPQGTDFERAVMHFHEKKPLGKRGVFWLKVHIANSLGYDKVSFEERVKFVEQGWSRLLADSVSPEDSDIYRSADSPMSALAAVFELDKAMRSGNPETFLSGLPVHMDATCSGLQHFSAMLRDPVGGKYVNLLNTGKREDIYQRLADILNERIVKLSESDGDVGLYASIWKELKVTRALAKKPVMTYVYSATIRGITDDVVDYLLEIGWRQPGVSMVGLAGFMSKLMFEAIAEVVPAAAHAMKWLQKVARKATKGGSLVWETPTGFSVPQYYYKTEQLRVRVRSCGIDTAVYYKNTADLNAAKMANGVAPNFIHSMDASHLVKTVNACAHAGLTMVTIHDSFGTHACDVDTLLHHTKEQFVDLYKDPDLITKSFKSHIETGIGEESNNSNTSINSNIPIGNLVLTSVLSSPFFFS